MIDAPPTSFDYPLSVALVYQSVSSQDLPVASDPRLQQKSPKHASGPASKVRKGMRKLKLRLILIGMRVVAKHKVVVGHNVASVSNRQQNGRVVRLLVGLPVAK